MKTSVQILMIFLFSSTIMFAQSTVLEGRIIKESEVPESVLNTQNEKFPNANVTRWKLQRATGVKGNSAKRYVSVFKLGKRSFSNAKYKPDGTIVFFSEYYGARNIPEIVKPDLSINFSGHKITSGVYIKLYERRKEYYRIRLKKRAEVIYMYYDKSGNQVDRNALPADASFN